MNDLPRVSFGLIVLNGEPFLRYNLRALYPFAHQIIVVEGAVRSAANVATADGHSRDGTLETLRRFKAEEDPQDKLQIVTRDGFWSEKDEMSQAYAERATGDYLWQVDVDEFYQPEAMRAILETLRDDSEITAVSFPTISFWGSPDYVVDGWYLRRWGSEVHRIFKWGPGYRYATHRPPTVHLPGGQNARDVKWLRAGVLAQRNIDLYHYSLLLPKQVVEKADYYSRAEWAEHAREMTKWAQTGFIQLRTPFRVHNVYQYPSWLERFHGEHPPQVRALWRDLQAGRGGTDVRQTADVEQLLASARYKLGRELMKTLDYPARLPGAARRVAKRILIAAGLWNKDR